MTLCTIVIAYVDNDGMRPTGRQVRFDGVNTRPEFESCERGHALVWLKRGTADNVRKAQAYAATLTDKVRIAVYTYPPEERDPLGKARARIMSGAQ